MKFRDWVLGSASESSTFKDFMDCVKNGSVCGLLGLGMLSLPTSGAVGVYKMLWYSVFTLAMTGVLGMFVMVLIQVSVIIERMPVGMWPAPKARWARRMYLSVVFVLLMSGTLAVPLAAIVVIAAKL